MKVGKGMFRPQQLGGPEGQGEKNSHPHFLWKHDEMSLLGLNEGRTLNNGITCPSLAPEAKVDNKPSCNENVGLSMWLCNTGVCAKNSPSTLWFPESLLYSR